MVGSFGRLGGGGADVGAGVLPRGHPLVLHVQVWGGGQVRRGTKTTFRRRSAGTRTKLSPFASSKDVILWLGLKPCRAPIRLVLPGGYGWN